MKCTTFESISLAWRGSSLTHTMPSVATCHASCVSTSATATLNRLRTRWATDLTTIRLPLSELFSAMCSSMRATPTCIVMSAIGLLSLAELKAFNHPVKRRAELLELLGGRRARDDVGG